LAFFVGQIRHSRLDYRARDRVAEVSDTSVLRRNGNNRRSRQLCKGEAKLLIISFYLNLPLVPFSHFSLLLQVASSAVARQAQRTRYVNVNSTWSSATRIFASPCIVTLLPS